MDPKEELVKSWLDMALRDLESAIRLASGLVSISIEMGR
jgi:hypothetical protein